jgi:uncharacterized protein (DUF427 family)
MALRFADHERAAITELRWHPEAKRIRGFLNGVAVVDSTRARIVWEPRRIVPSFAIPVEDIDAVLVATDADMAEQHPVRLGEGRPVLDPSTPFTFHTTEGLSYDLSVGSSTRPAAAFAPADSDLDGHVLVDFAAFEEWREEDEVLVGHARDPFKTVDTRRSSRRVEIRIAGTVCAQSTRSVMLFETYLPTRYYLSREDVRMDLLVPTDTVSVCAYKGRARYWSAHVDDIVMRDVAWSYEAPHNYATAVTGMVSFFNERVDISVDGEPMARPLSPWSEPSG